MSVTRPKILFIVGAGRSGSTLIDQVLGQADGFCSIGELNAIWSAGLGEGEKCGCGASIRDCPFWSAVLAKALRPDDPEPHELAALINEHIIVRPRAIVAMLKAANRSNADSQLHQYLDVLRRMYEAVASVSGTRVIVDSTKLPEHAFAASLVPTVDVYVLHVVRDPRAVAYSWLRNPDAGSRRLSGVDYRSIGTVTSTVQWTFRSAAAELLLRPRLGSRFMRLRYEDFTARPEESVRNVTSFLNEQTANSFLVDDRTVVLGDNHIVAGNRVKHLRGAISIKVDDAWDSAMSPIPRLVCLLLAWPLMLRYGYSLRTSYPRSDAS